MRKNWDDNEKKLNRDKHGSQVDVSSRTKRILILGALAIPAFIVFMLATEAITASINTKLII